MSVYAEIMDCYFCIYLLQDSKYLMVYLIELCIVRNNRIIMNDHMHTKSVQTFPFDAVNLIMTHHWIDLYMNTCILSARAIIMYQQVMTAKYQRTAAYISNKLFPQTGICTFSKKRRDCILCKRNSAYNDKNRYQPTHKTIYFPSADMFYNCCGKNCSCCQHIISAVCGCSK